jgi:hypothetical protein
VLTFGCCWMATEKGHIPVAVLVCTAAMHLRVVVYRCRVRQPVYPSQPFLPASFYQISSVSGSVERS